MGSSVVPVCTSCVLAAEPRGGMRVRSSFRTDSALSTLPALRTAYLPSNKVSVSCTSRRDARVLTRRSTTGLTADRRTMS